MSFLDKARQAAEQARQAAASRAAQAQQRISEQAPLIQAQTREGLGLAGANLKVASRSAKKGMAGLVDKIDPGILADIIIKATALQERANDSLRTKGSPYRIDEITITAALPPQVGFTIARIGDVEEELTGREVESAELIDHLELADVSLEELAASTELEPDGTGTIPAGSPSDPATEASAVAAVSSAEAAASFADAAASSADAAASFADAASDPSPDGRPR